MPMEAIGWNMADCEPWWTDRVDIVYTASKEVWRGRSARVETNRYAADGGVMTRRERRRATMSPI